MNILQFQYSQQKNKFLQQSNKNKVFFQLLTLILLVFLAFSRWIPGGDELNPASGIRGYLEIFLLILALGGCLSFWGADPLVKILSNLSSLSLLIFGLWAFVSSTWSSSILLAVGKSVAFLMMIIIASAIAYTASQFQIPIYKPILFALLALILIQTLNNYFIYHEFLPIRFIGGRDRLVLGFNHPNLSVSYFSSATIISIYIFLTKPKLIKNISLLFLSGILLIFIYLSNSRTDLFSIIVCITYLFFASIKSKHIKWIIFLVLAELLLLAVFIMTSGVLDNFVISFLQKNPDLITLNGRTILWSSVFTQVTNKIFIGIGYFSSRFVSIENLNILWGTHLHNSFLEVLITTGLIGSFFAFGFIISSIYNSFVQKSQLSITYLIYVIIISFTETRIFIPSIVMFITCLLVFHNRPALYK